MCSTLNERGDVDKHASVRRKLEYLRKLYFLGISHNKEPYQTLRTTYRALVAIRYTDKLPGIEEWKEPCFH